MKIYYILGSSSLCSWYSLFLFVHLIGAQLELGQDKNFYQRCQVDEDNHQKHHVRQY